MGSILGWGKRTFWVLGGLAVAVPVILWAIGSGHKDEPATQAERPQPEKEKPAPPNEEKAVEKAPAESAPAPEPAVEAEVAVDPQESTSQAAPRASQPAVEPAVVQAQPVVETSLAQDEDYPEDVWAGVAQFGDYYTRDRRRWVRGSCLLPATIVASRGEFVVDILNICPNGLGLRAHGGHAEPPLEAQEDVKVTLTDPALTITARVEWSAQDSKGMETAGLTFADGTSRFEISSMLRKAGWNSSHYKQRRHSRIRYAQDCSAQLADSQDHTFEVQLFSIGPGGAGVRLAQALTVGDQVGLSITSGKKKGDMKIPGVVVDIQGERHHLKFLPMQQGLRKRFEGYLKSQEKN